MSLNRLYVFTGKGGVGKTTCALSLANYLTQIGKKSLYVEFEPQVGEKLFKNLKIEHYLLSILESANGYIAKKLKSKVLASWVIKTPFFKSLLNMIPGFNYIIFLGHLLEMLHNDPDLILIVDSPSSGHAITMFEASKNFQDIFQKGLIFDDINKMLNLVHTPNFLKIVICAMPTQMCVNEAIELNSHLHKLGFNETTLVLNNCYSLSTENSDKLPEFLMQKLELERQVIFEFKNNFLVKFPHISEIEMENIIKKLSDSIKEII